MNNDGATLKGYLNQWSDCFNCERSPNELSQYLQGLAFQGQLRGCNFRSICWRVFLNCFPPNPNLWQDVTSASRAKYQSIKTKHICDPEADGEKSDIAVENPLSQDDQSVWKRFFKNQELKKTIERDVTRTFPEIKYFHNDDVHALLIDVLFCYACEHAELSYRQGMHELLAPLVFIIHCDLEAASYAKESGEVNELIECVLDERYLEHDAYNMFCQLMESTNKWYSVTAIATPPCVSTEASQKETSEDLEKPFREKPVATTGTLAIANKLCHIYNTLLVKHDIELHVHLNRLEIIPQVFGLRWIRLLFGREFSLQDLLVLWDAIFADGPSLDLVDYLFVAMLTHIRQQLLASDYTTCLQILMKYPPVDDINDVVQAAKQIREGRRVSTSSQASSFPSRIFSSISGTKLSSDPPKVNKQNGFLKVLQDFKKKVTPENRSTPSRPRAQVSNVPNGDFAPNRNSVPRLDNSGASRSKIEKMEVMCSYCSDKIDACIATLQSHVTTRSSVTDKTETIQDSKDQGEPAIEVPEDEQEKGKRDQLLLTLANLKQVRDILKGTINFELSIASDIVPSEKT